MKGGMGGVCSSRHSWGRAIDGVCTRTASAKYVATCPAAGDPLLVSRIQSGEMCTSSARLVSTSAAPPSSSSFSGCHSSSLCPPPPPSPSPSPRPPPSRSSCSSFSFSSVHHHRRTLPTSKSSCCAGVRASDWPTRTRHDRSRSNHVSSYVVDHGWSKQVLKVSAGFLGVVVDDDNHVATCDTFAVGMQGRDARQRMSMDEEETSMNDLAIERAQPTMHVQIPSLPCGTFAVAMRGRDAWQRMSMDDEETSLKHPVIERAQATMHVPIPLLTTEPLSKNSASSPDSDEEKPGPCSGIGSIERRERPVVGDAIPLLSSSSSSSSYFGTASPSSSSSTLPTSSSWQSGSQEWACYGGGWSRRGAGGRGCRQVLSGSVSVGPCELAGKPLPRPGERRAEASWWWWRSAAIPMIVSVHAMGRGPDGAPEGPGGEKRDGQRPSEDKSIPTERLKDLKFRPIVEGRGEWATDQLITASNGQFDSNLATLGVCSRVLYSLGMYGGLALVGNVLCTIAGVDFWGGFDFNPDDFLTGLLYAGPLVALQYVMRQEAVVKKCPVARALDDEIAEYFAGMSMPQLILVVIASSTAEEFFFRSAVQGGISHALQVTGRGVTETTYGMAALTGIIPPFGPFFPIVAAAIAAAITGSMYYALSTPEDPKYIIAPVHNGKHNTRREVKKQVKDWCRKRQLQKIYGPLLEALLSLYLGLEWLQTGNLLTTVITHGLFQVIMTGDGVWQKKTDDEKKNRREEEKLLAFLGGRHRQLPQRTAEMEDMSSNRKE